MLPWAYKYQKQLIKVQKNTDKFLEKNNKNNIKCCNRLTNIRNSRQRHRKTQTNFQKKLKIISRSVLPTPVSANLTY